MSPSLNYPSCGTCLAGFILQIYRKTGDAGRSAERRFPAQAINLVVNKIRDGPDKENNPALWLGPSTQKML